MARARPAVPPESSDRLGRYFTNYRLRFVEGAGHFAPVEYPETFAEEILAAAA